MIGQLLGFCRAPAGVAGLFATTLVALFRAPVRGLALVLAIAVAAPFAFVGQAQAQAATETANYSISVTISNSFSLGSLGIAFGRISALASPTDQATLTIDAETGANTVANPAFARIIIIQDGVPGEVDVVSGPPNTLMAVSITTNPTTVAHETDGGAATFSAVLTAFGAGYNFTTDATGDMLFKVGGVLSTDAAGGTYSDGNYSGIYTVKVSYRPDPTRPVALGAAPSRCPDD